MNKNKIITIPNIISIIRIILVFVFLYELLKDNYFISLLLLVLAGTTDYLDGYLARKLNQFSVLGEMIDPIADRLLIFLSFFCLTIKNIVPILFFLLIIIRELTVFIYLIKISKYKMRFPAVNYAGKVGSLLIMVTLPSFLITTMIKIGVIQNIFNYLIFSILIWGIYFYYLAGLIYIIQMNEMLKNYKHNN